LRPETPERAEVSISRYAEPEAEGVTPVFRTGHNQYVTSGKVRWRKIYRHIFLMAFDARSRCCTANFCSSTSSVAKTGATVPPTGPLIRLLSAISAEICSQKQSTWLTIPPNDAEVGDAEKRLTLISSKPQ
jgi:hypothetical protein